MQVKLMIMHGKLKQTIFYNGKKLYSQEDNNLLVYNVHTVLSHLVGQAISEGSPTLPATPESYQINKMKIGKSDNITEVKMTDVIDPEPRNLTTSFYDMETTAYITDVSTDSEVKYSAFMEIDEGNGEGSVIYREAGLFTNNEIMIARSAFSGIQKNAAISILFEWTIAQA